jgi:hypothetical protein
MSEEKAKYQWCGQIGGLSPEIDTVSNVDAVGGTDYTAVTPCNSLAHYIPTSSIERKPLTPMPKDEGFDLPAAIDRLQALLMGEPKKFVSVKLKNMSGDALCTFCNVPYFDRWSVAAVVAYLLELSGTPRQTIQEEMKGECTSRPFDIPQVGPFAGMRVVQRKAMWDNNPVTVETCVDHIKVTAEYETVHFLTLGEQAAAEWKPIELDKTFATWQEHVQEMSRNLRGMGGVSPDILGTDGKPNRHEFKESEVWIDDIFLPSPLHVESGIAPLPSEQVVLPPCLEASREGYGEPRKLIMGKSEHAEVMKQLSAASSVKADLGMMPVELFPKDILSTPSRPASYLFVSQEKSFVLVCRAADNKLGVYQRHPEELGKSITSLTRVAATVPNEEWGKESVKRLAGRTNPK